MTTWTDSLGPESIYDDEDGLLSGILNGSLFRLGFLAAGVGVAFGVGMALGGQDNPSPPPAPTQAAGLLAAADARTKTHERVKNRLEFHEELKGHPSTEGVPEVKPPAPAPKAKAAPTAPKVEAPQPPPAPVVPAAATPKPEAAPPPPPKAKVPEEERIVVEDGVDSLDDELSATEKKVERKDNMAHLRSALLKVLGEDTPVWSEDHTPPSLRSQRQAAQRIAQADAKAAEAKAKAPKAKAAAKKPAAKPVAPKPSAKSPASVGAFALQVASIADKVRAEEVASELKKLNKRARVVSATVKGATVYRVQVVGFATREAADKEKAKLGRGFVVGL